ncbi:hypothetical protein D3C85_1529590 [compost metagenome]
MWAVVQVVLLTMRYALEQSVSMQLTWELISFIQAFGGIHASGCMKKLTFAIFTLKATSRISLLWTCHL